MPIIDAIETPKPAPLAPIIAASDEWLGWSDERTTRDDQTGEIVTYREQVKTRKRREIRRESSIESA